MSREEGTPAKIQKLVGFDNFKRNNPKSDHYNTKKFHHLEFYTADASNTARRYSTAFGMQMVASSDVMTQNYEFQSYVLQTNETRFVFTAPYFTDAPKPEGAQIPWHNYNPDKAYDQIKKHGIFVRAVALEVEDATVAYNEAVKKGGRPALAPHTTKDEHGSAVVSEIELYADVVLRFVELKNYKGVFLPNFEASGRPPISYGITRVDHCVSNVPELLPQVRYMSMWTGWHEFAEFVAADVGTENSGLNSVVLANNNEMVLLPLNEPVHGTKRKSQIQMYLEHNKGPGIQHIALKTDDIFKTLRLMQQKSVEGGIDFMPKPNRLYYERLPARIGDVLTLKQYQECEELGILVDKDDQGTLLQIFTKPLQDRPTLFIEIIQRVGCIMPDGDQLAGCGGFGKGNFSELFKSIEDYEKMLSGDDKKEKAQMPC